QGPLRGVGGAVGRRPARGLCAPPGRRTAARGALVRVVLALAFAGTVLAADQTSVAPFSAMAAGEVKPPWREVALPNIKPVRFDLVADEGATVLRARAEAAAGSMTHALDAAPSAFLSWRWKVNRIVEGAAMTQKSGDDFAARVYVFFD